MGFKIQENDTYIDHNYRCAILVPFIPTPFSFVPHTKGADHATRQEFNLFFFTTSLGTSFKKHFLNKKTYYSENGINGAGQ